MYLRHFQIAMLVAAASAVVVLVGMHPPAAASSRGEIIGHVTDRATNAQLAGAEVTVLSTTGTYRTETDRNGFYSIVSAYPNTYAISVSANDYVSAGALGGAVNPDQTTVINIQLDKSAPSTLTSSMNSPLKIFQPNVSADEYVLNAAAADSTNGSGGSYGLYQVPGILATLPGATLDAGVNAHIRGSRLDEVGYEFDGVSAVEPITGLPATNLIENGVVRLQLNETGGESTSPASIGPFVNSVADVGSYPARGSITILTQSPTMYHGANFEYGGATADKRLSWFLSGVVWSSAYDWGTRDTFSAGPQSGETSLGDGQVGDAFPSRDQLFNFHYKLGADFQDDVQVLSAAGRERFDNILLPPYWPSTNPLNAPSTSPAPVNGLCNNNGFALFPGQRNCTSPIGGQQDHTIQAYTLDKVAYTHAFQSSATLEVQYDRISSSLNVSNPFGDGPASDLWESRTSDQRDLRAEYSAQVGARHLVRAGAADGFSANAMLLEVVSSGYGVVAPANSRDRSYWIADEFRPSLRTTIDIVDRTNSRSYYRLAAPAFTASGNDAELGIAQELNGSTVVRAAYGEWMKLPSVSQAERIVTRAPNFSDISGANQISLLEAQPEPARVQSFDLSFEKAIDSSRTFKFTQFWRRSPNMFVALADGGRLGIPQSVGEFNAHGISAEAQFLHGGNGLSGYADYTHTRATGVATGDFLQPVSIGALTAHASFAASYIAPDVANVVVTWHHQRWTFNPVIEYSSGYPFGVGRLAYNSLNCIGSTATDTGDPTKPCGAVVRNPAAYADTTAGQCGPGACTRLLDPSESTFADGRVCCSALTANLNVFYSLTDRTHIGVQWQNLTHNYRPLAMTKNPYIPTSPFGPPGFNGVVNYGSSPYVPAAINTSEEFILTISQRL